METLENGCLHVDGGMQASIPGVFAEGDILCRDMEQAVLRLPKEQWQRSPRKGNCGGGPSLAWIGIEGG